MRVLVARNEDHSAGQGGQPGRRGSNRGELAASMAYRANYDIMAIYPRALLLVQAVLGQAETQVVRVPVLPAGLPVASISTHVGSADDRAGPGPTSGTRARRRPDPSDRSGALPAPPGQRRHSLRAGDRGRRRLVQRHQHLPGPRDDVRWVEHPGLGLAATERARP